MRLVFVVALLLACEVPPPTMAKEHPDADWGFSLTTPAGWVRLGHDALRLQSPSAVAAWQSVAGAGFATLSVTDAPGADLDALMNSLIESRPLEHMSVERNATIECAGEEARELVLEGDRDGDSFRFHYVRFSHADHVYSVMAYAPLGADAPDFSPIFDALRLLPGPITGSETALPESDVLGDVWRVHAGRYENFASGLVVTPPPGWRTVVGRELHAIHSGSEIGFAWQSPTILAVVTSEPAPEDGATLERHLLDANALALGGVREEQTIRMLGESVSARIFQHQSFEYQHAVRCARGRCVQFLIWYAADATEEARAVLGRGRPEVDWLSDGDREVLGGYARASLAQRRAFGPHHALRGRRFVDFANGLTLHLPADGYWQVWAETEAHTRAGTEMASAYLSEPLLGVRGVVVVEPLPSAMSLDDYHRVATSQNESETPEVAEFGSHPGRVSDGTQRMEQTGDQRQRVLTTVVDGVGYRFVFGGHPDAMRRARPAIDALLAGMEFTGRSRPDGAFENGVWVDDRLGFALELPGTGWELTSEQPQDVASNAAAREFIHGDERVTVSVVYPHGEGEGAREASMDAVVEVMVASFRRGSSMQPAPTVRLLGRDALHFRSPGAEIVIVHDDKHVYSLLVEGLQAEGVARGMSRLP